MDRERIYDLSGERGVSRRESPGTGVTGIAGSARRLHPASSAGGNSLREKRSRRTWAWGQEAASRCCPESRVQWWSFVPLPLYHRVSSCRLEGAGWGMAPRTPVAVAVAVSVAVAVAGEDRLSLHRPACLEQDEQSVCIKRGGV